MLIILEMKPVHGTLLWLSSLLLTVVTQVGTLNAAVIYSGNGDTSFNGAVGNGSLALNDDGTTVSGTFSRGTSGNFNDSLVIYIDSVSGGFTSTSGFTDTADALRRSISGYNGGTDRSTANFVSGFTANYAIALGVNGPNFGGLWGLVGSGSHNFISSVNLSPANIPGNTTFGFSFTWAQIGLTANTAGNAFNIQSRYISGTGFGSLETFEDFSSGSTGYNPVTFSTSDTYLTAVPEPTNIALGAFGLVLLFGGVWRHLRQLLSPSSRG